MTYYTPFIVAVTILCIPYLFATDELLNNFLTAAITHLEKGNLEEGWHCLTAALELNRSARNLKKCANLLFQLGNNFFDCRKPDKALSAFRKILTISDSFPEVHHNIGFTLAEQCGKHEEALVSYRRSLELTPDNVATHFCLSLSLLATGNFLEGFKEYEWRWLRGQRSPRPFAWPLEKLWDGTAPIKGKRILIRSEQGFGDIFHFIRYAKLLKDDGAFVIVESYRALIPLLSLCSYIDQLCILGSSLPAFDFQIPLLNLPSAYRTTRETAPNHVPYLYAGEYLDFYWKLHLADNHNFKIGICWYGDSIHEPDKFMPLSYFTKLTTIPQITLYSLQQVTGLDQITKQHRNIVTTFDVDFDKKYGRFMDTAALMKNLDLVITVDTSIAHLAGALGVPVWVIVPFPAEWRWLTDTEYSVWYPTMRLFRQQHYGDWTEVYDQLCKELKKLVH